MPQVSGYERGNRKDSGKHSVSEHWRPPSAREIAAKARRFARDLRAPIKAALAGVHEQRLYRKPEQLRVRAISQRAGLWAAVPLVPAGVLLTPVVGFVSLPLAAAAIAGHAFYHRRRASTVPELDANEYVRELSKMYKRQGQNAAKWTRRKTKPARRWIRKRARRLRNRLRKGYLKKKAEVKAEFKRQCWVIGYTFVPGLRWAHGRQVTQRRAALTRERAKQKTQATYLTGLYESVEERQQLINAELALGQSANTEYLRVLRTDQAAEVSEWIEVSDNQSIRNKILTAEAKELKQRESALREAGWKPKKKKKGKRKASKGAAKKTAGGIGIGTQRSVINQIDNSPFGTGSDDSFEALLDIVKTGQPRDAKGRFIKAEPSPSK